MRKAKPPRPKLKRPAPTPLRKAARSGGVALPPLLKQAADAKRGVLLNLVNSGPQLPAELKKHPYVEIQIAAHPSATQVAGDIRDLSFILSNVADIVWNSGSLVYAFAHQVPLIVKELHRVIKPGGLLVMHLPDLQRVAEQVADGRLEQSLYRSPGGDITGLDLIFGHVESIAKGQLERLSHTGFTAATISRKLAAAGFGEVDVWRQGWLLRVQARKVKAIPADKPVIRLHDDDVNLRMQKRDTIEREPEIWKPVKL